MKEIIIKRIEYEKSDLPQKIVNEIEQIVNKYRDSIFSTILSLLNDPNFIKDFIKDGNVNWEDIWRYFLIGKISGGISGAFIRKRYR